MTKVGNFIVPLNLLLFMGCLSFVTACNSSKKIDKGFLYFQNERDSSIVYLPKERVVKPNDQLTIQILSNTLNQEQASIFKESGTRYIVGSGGRIELPVLGIVNVAGLTKLQIQNLLSDKLSQFVKDPLVYVKFSNYTVNVLGEVNEPGIKSFATDQVTLLDAISASGDLTDFGKRNDITVIRQENGKMKYSVVDLRSGSLFKSAVYQLQSDDIVYVGANNKKLKSLNENVNRRSGLEILLSVASLVSSLAFLIVTVSK